MTNIAWRAVQVLSVATVLAVVFVAADGFGLRPLVVNVTESVPRGVYVRTFGDVRRGTIVRIPLPDVMFDYISHWPEWEGFLRKGGLLKPVVGIEGDVICRSRRGDFSVNARPLGMARMVGPEGRALPSWGGCRRLGHDQLAVFSDRVPDGLDSRLYGPVPASTAVPYRLLWEF